MNIGIAAVKVLIRRYKPPLELNLMTIRILTDSDIESVGMANAIACMEEAFRQHAAGSLVAPGRLVSDVQAGQLVFTVGASVSDSPVLGFRVYDLNQLHSAKRAEITAVLDGTDGSLRGLVTGPLLGAVRTGAIGGVAVKYLARDDAKSLGVIGTGFQARTQLEAAVKVREFTNVKVYSRAPQRRTRFAEHMSRKLDREIRAMDSAQSAVEDADVLICATTSNTPVLDAHWLKPGVHINNVGPKFKNRAELDIPVMERARLVTDSPRQAETFGDTFILHGTSMANSIEDLSTIVANASPHAKSRAPCKAERVPDQITLFISLGLAGTEVVLANQLLAERS